MPAVQLHRAEPQENTDALRAQLEAELDACSEADSTGRNHVRDFMIDNGIWHIAELDYSLRERFEAYLGKEISLISLHAYLRAFDKVKQHAVRGKVRLLQDGKPVRPPYKNEILYLPYHQNPEIAKKFDNSTKKKDLVWDFSCPVSERMKRQVHQVLHYEIENMKDKRALRKHLVALRKLYDHCVETGISDIEKMELEQIEGFIATLQPGYERKCTMGAIDRCRYVLFMEAKDIRWETDVWYVERLHLKPERLNPSKPIRNISFLEVPHKKNREYLKKYIRYGLGITELSLSAIIMEMRYIRSFLSALNMKQEETVCCVTSERIEYYFEQLNEKGLQAESYNKQVMSILRFFQFLQARQHVGKMPFQKDTYLKKAVPQHHNRSVEEKTVAEILSKLHCFPEEVRLMYLHLWGLGLRLSEVCTLKGDAYYIQGEDAWIKVYQIKMRTYKRIPIPTALYKLMQVYLKKYHIGVESYVFQNQKGGAYHSGTFQLKMKECCEKNNIRNGMYVFQSHDYRHSIATYFYDEEVSLQGIRDYLGHVYEEMTRQYVDYMSRKVAKANEAYFSGHSLAAALRKEVKENGNKDLSERPSLL